MSKPKEPGDIPAWQKSLQSLNMIDRAKLALALGYSPASVNNWAQGRNVPRPDTLKRIERRLGVKA
jgi:transcriptional regulator with XRE-family HTH domain